MILARRAAIHGAGALVHENLHFTDGERGHHPTWPLGHRGGAGAFAVEGVRGGHVVREERDLDDVSQVAISNSRRTSLSDVLRSVDVFRDPTMSAHGRS